MVRGRLGDECVTVTAGWSDCPAEGAGCESKRILRAERVDARLRTFQTRRERITGVYVWRGGMLRSIPIRDLAICWNESFKLFCLPVGSIVYIYDRLEKTKKI